MSVQIAFALVNGLAYGMALFLVAAGLTLVFGILRILNFSHGAFFMIGAYLAFTLVGRGDVPLPLYIAASLFAGAVVGLLGLLADRIVLRRLKAQDEAYMLIATFGLLVFCQGMVHLIWGHAYHSVSPPAALSGVVFLGPVFIPVFSLFVIAVGVLVFAALDLAIHRSWIGKTVQSLASDPWMTGLLGVNTTFLFTAVVMVAFLLAGFAGGILLPYQALSPELGHAYTLNAFVAVIIGGLGSVRGAFLASILLGVMESMSSLLLPNLPGVALFATMIAVLLLRPQGLLAGAG